VNEWRRKISGVNNKLLFRAEDEILMLSVSNPDYAINPTLLRAVLNGFYIDMKIACTKFDEEKLFGSKIKQMQQEFRDDRAKLEEKMASSSEDEVVSDLEPDLSEESESKCVAVIHKGTPTFIPIFTLGLGLSGYKNLLS